MKRTRPFRFGFLGTGSATKKEWVEKARKAEDLGYSLMLMADHLSAPFTPFPAMLAAAEATTSLRVGSYVLGNDFRNPVDLAREAVTVDVLTEGRLELGLGTGYYLDDYQGLGLPLDPPSVRVSRLEEALQIIKLYFAGNPFTFRGNFYHLEVKQVNIAPVQKPHPPLLLGGGGRRVLSLAAREADIVSINPKSTPDGGLDASNISPEATAQKVEWVCQAAGERLDHIEMSVIVPGIKITPSRAEQVEAAEGIRKAFGLTDKDITISQLIDSPHFYYGSEEDIVEKFFAVRERYGISHFILFEPLEGPARIVKRLAGK